ncbi:hypothetical protein RHSIM_Rhsim02G0069000 [Rhododendron simsii]|uniref:Uncharacterized protein n=1 Tax=Rhododendron simsii TaxID=118357 RepID=A0A834LYH3_RHOSS|nr:hypothetical protein RHSIM_Rhsim02G0069000 [Rhododendron simsii]
MQRLQLLACRKKPTMASVPKRAPNFLAVHSKIIFVFVIILIPFVSSSDSTGAHASPNTQTVAKQSEAVALLKWKASLEYQSQSLLSSWNETSHCTWVGIGCNEASKVTNLNLDSIGLRGTLSGLNFSLLPHLVKLDLSNNLIYGTIPSQIGGLSRLASLDVSINHLSGRIPSEVGMLRSLIELDLSMNNLTGSIPTSIGNLKNLTTLYFYENSLSGSIPQEVGMQKSLIYLALYTNNLTGSIPASIANLRNLTLLYLYKNSLSGSIPQEVGMLKSLISLALYTNNLTGSIPPSIGNLRNLTLLYLYKNFLSGSIPQEVGMLKSLIDLQLPANNLTGSIPASIGNLRNLTTFRLHQNSLCGSIPQELGMLRSLTDLQLSRNKLTGSIPASIGNLRNLTTLYLHYNSLSGSIPQEIGLLRSLIDLELSRNKLTGSIPTTIGNLRNLITSYLDKNSLSGSIPQEVGMLRSLTDLRLSMNNLTGQGEERISAKSVAEFTDYCQATEEGRNQNGARQAVEKQSWERPQHGTLKETVDEIGRVVSVRDGIAHVYELNEIQAGEMVEFASGVKGIALNLENENVGFVVFGSDTVIKEGDLVMHTGSIVDVPAAKAMLGRVVNGLGVPIDGRGSLGDHKLICVKVKAPRIIECKSVHEPMQTSLKVVDSLVPQPSEDCDTLSEYFTDLSGYDEFGGFMYLFEVI